MTLFPSKHAHIWAVFEFLAKRVWGRVLNLYKHVRSFISSENKLDYLVFILLCT